MNELKHLIIPDGKDEWRCQSCAWSSKAASTIVIECPAIRRFQWFDDPTKPVGYLTQTQLDKEGMKPGAAPRGFIWWRTRRQLYLLFDHGEAIAKRVPTPAQAAALEKAQAALRTCSVCGAVEERRIIGERKGKDWQLCLACWACLGREERRIEVLGLRRWAQRLLARGDVVILDTETTGLSDAEVIDIAVISAAGEVLLNSLVKPRWPPEPRAVAVHKITMDMLGDAPLLEDLLPQLTALLHGRRVVVYNASFDRGVLRGCLWERGLDADAWDKAIHWRDLMGPWSDWVGESRNETEYRWQPLGGDHRALGDCQAALRCLQMMADPAHVYGGRGYEWQWCYDFDTAALASP